MIPICLVCEKAGDDEAAEKDYNQYGSGEVSLQVEGCIAPFTVHAHDCIFHVQHGYTFHDHDALL